MVGTTISHYKVLEKIGQGGMGEVYRAEDTNLSREVAIKVLPEQFTQDPQRLARFEREAKLLASLNHPNIAAIHSFEHSDDIHFLVLELVEGETLAERVAKGPLAVEEALEVCRQIAEGVEAAHEKGVIHRDLKPANVKITPEGKIKILDFGLAKAFEGDTPVTDISQSPTLPEGMTRAGMILGTASYMSPEQARGKSVDQRADIWAFGCVVYELLTAKRAFPGETVADTLAKILEREPNWGALPGSLPSTLRSLVSRCLQKDLTQRLQHMDGARILIEEALSGASAASAIGVASPAQSTKWRWAIPWGLAGLIAVLALWNPWYPNPSEPTPVRRYTFNLGPTEPIRPNGVSSNLALSPDGTRLVYTARVDGTTQLYMRRIDQLEAEVVPGTNGADRPFFSPDGEWVGFFTRGSDRKLKKVSVSGGQPQILCDVQGSGAGSWGPDDTIVISAREDSGTIQLFRVAAAGGRPEILTSPDRERGERSHRQPEILPGGNSVLFTIGSVGHLAWSIAVLSLESGEYRTVIERGYNAHYVPTGHVVFALEGQLWAVPFDLSQLETTGPQTPILQGIQVDSGRGILPFSSSGDGLLVYVPGADVAAGLKRSLVWVDRQGNEEFLAMEPGRYDRPQVSPDGSRVAVAATGSGTSDIWIYDLGREQLSRLTFDSADDMLPLWSPDGLRVFFSSNRGGQPYNLFWKAADGTGQAQRLTTSSNDQYVHSCSPDGKILAFCGPNPGTSMDLGLLSMGSESTAVQVFKAEFSEAVPAISPYGNWMAYASNETGSKEVFVHPFPNLEGGKWQISSGGARTQPVWGPDSDELFYLDDQAMMVVPLETGPTLVAGNPKVLFPDRRYYIGDGYFDISPDGQRFLMMKVVAQAEKTSTQFVFVENWFEELKRQVPTE